VNVISRTALAAVGLAAVGLAGLTGVAYASGDDAGTPTPAYITVEDAPGTGTDGTGTTTRDGRWNGVRGEDCPERGGSGSSPAPSSPSSPSVPSSPQPSPNASQASSVDL
jgi:hypothetical protein